MAKTEEIEIEGRAVRVSNLEKVLYPAAGFTKAHVIDYYVRVSRFLLPHLKNRPVTLKRYPDGIHAPFFYQKDAPRFTPGWVKTFPAPRRTGGADIRYILINDLPTLVWSANLANLEIHPFLHRAPKIDTPVEVVFDLDPGEGAGIIQCADVACLLNNVLERLNLQSFPKVSGSRGIQLHVPLNTPVTYDATKAFAHGIAEFLEREHPENIVAKMAKAARKGGKVLIDWSQNADFKTTVGVYSLRAKREQPFVAMPVTWKELEQAQRRRKTQALDFDAAAALKRLEENGDLFAPLLKLKQKIPKDAWNS